MRVSRRGSQALALGAGIAALIAVAAPHGYAASMPEPHANALAVVKISNPASVAAGSLLTYTITVTNDTVATSATTLSDPLPAGFNVQSATFVTNANPAPAAAPCAAAVTTPGTLATQVQTVTCALGPLTAASPGNAATVTITAIPLVTGTNLQNTATATAPEYATAYSSTAQTTVTGSPVTCFGSVPTIIGTPGNDDILGTSGDDVIVGLGGNDVIDGGEGNDKICGGDGDDHLYGGRGNDSLAGGDGSDVVDGGSGTNTLKGGSDSTNQQGPWPGGNHHNGNRDGRNGHDTLICQRNIDTCDGGFRGNNNDNIVFIGQDRNGHDGDHHGRHHRHHRGDFRDFAANKGTPMKPAAKPVAKPLDKPAPAVAGTKPVAPKA
jgi:uncharacterized repeat protein (TIGR01451 family)